MKKRFNFRLEHFVIAGSVALILVGILVFGRRPRGMGHDPRGNLQGSTRYTTPGGGKAFHDLLRNLGFPVLRHERSIGLASGSLRVLFLLAPLQKLKNEEVAGFVRWVEKGNTLVWCPREGKEADPKDPLPAGFGLETVAGGVQNKAEASLAPMGGPPGAAYALSVAPGPRLRAGEGFPAQPLAAGGGEWVVAMVPRGTGRFVALADVRLVSNEGLRNAGNAEFMVHLAAIAAKGGTIGFDEFHRGFKGDQSAFAVVWESPLGPAILLILAGAFLGVLSTGRRLGPPVDLHEERRRRPAEFIEAFAGLCRRMGAASQAMAMVSAEFRLFLKRRLAIFSPGAAEALAGRAGLAPSAVADVLERARRVAADHRAWSAAFLSCCCEIEHVRRALIGAAERRRVP